MITSPIVLIKNTTSDLVIICLLILFYSMYFIIPFLYVNVKLCIYILFFIFFSFYSFLETEYRLFPPVTIFLDLFPRAGYFFNAFD